MPRRDKTGPRGSGPSTGRNLGPCAPGEERVVGNLRYGMGKRFQKTCAGRLGLGLARNSHLDREEILTEEKKILEGRLVEIDQILNKN